MKMKKLSPNFAVRNVNDTLKFYIEILKFQLVFTVPEGVNDMSNEAIFFKPFEEGKKYQYAVVKNDEVEIAFQDIESVKKDLPFVETSEIKASGTFYIQMDGVDAYFETIKNNVEVLKAPFTAWYGMKEFYIRDNNGYILSFSEQL